MLEPGLGVTRPWFLLYRVADRVACVAGAKGGDGEKAILAPRRRKFFGQRRGLEISPIPLAFIGT